MQHLQALYKRFRDYLIVFMEYPELEGPTRIIQFLSFHSLFNVHFESVHAQHELILVDSEFEK